MFEIANILETIRAEIEHGCPRKVIAQTYALGIKSSGHTDWAAVNSLIIERWSVSGLEYIKKLAWSGRCFEYLEQ